MRERERERATASTLSRLPLDRLNKTSRKRERAIGGEKKMINRTCTFHVNRIHVVQQSSIEHLCRLRRQRRGRFQPSMRNQRKLFTSPIRAGNSTEVEARVGWNFRGSVCPPPLLPRQLSLPGGAREGGRGRGTGEKGASFLSPPSSPSRVSPAAGRKLYRGPMMHRPEMARVVPGRKCGTYVRAHTCIYG